MEERYMVAINRYKNGESIKNICKDMKMWNKGLRNKLILKGIPIRGKSSTTKLISDSDKANIIKLFDNGKSIRFINELTGINRSDISTVLKLNKSTVTQRKLRLNEKVFDVIDDENKAYWLGFLIADGNVYKSILDVSLSSKDCGHLYKLKDFLETDAKISTQIMKKSGLCKSDNEYSRLYVCSKYLTTSLKKHGCIEKKSLKVTCPDIDKSLRVHFIRGLFDGDGCVSLDKWKTPSIVFNIVGTYDVTMYVKKFFNIRATPRKQGNIYSLTCKGNIKAVAVLDELYKDATIYLDRKYEKFTQLKRRLNTKS